MYKGVVVPMVTPVTKNGLIDKEAVNKIINNFVENGVSPLLMGTTGEGNSVSTDQSSVLAKTAIDAAKGRVMIYAGLNGCSFKQHVESADEYRKMGADVIVATLPSYYALTDEQMYNYYKTLADNITAPLMLYNIKATTHMSIPVETIKRLSKHSNIVGLKDSERDSERMKQCLDIAAMSENFSYFSGWAAQSADSLALGADGIVPSTGNYVPEMFKKLYESAVSGNIEQALQLQTETDNIAKIYQEGRTLGESLAALKVMMKTKDLCEHYMLPPLTELSPEQVNEVICHTEKLKR